MKKTKITYWVITVLFVLAMLQSGITHLIQTEGSKEVMNLLGYPLYLLTILGFTKILGALVLLQEKFRTLKEWAYAGFTIDFMGASASGAFIGEMLIVTVPLVFLAVMLLSYFLWEKKDRLKMTDPVKAMNSNPLTSGML